MYNKLQPISHGAVLRHYCIRQCPIVMTTPQVSMASTHSSKRIGGSAHASRSLRHPLLHHCIPRDALDHELSTMLQRVSGSPQKRQEGESQSTLKGTNKRRRTDPKAPDQDDGVGIDRVVATELASHAVGGQAQAEGVNGSGADGRRVQRHCRRATSGAAEGHDDRSDAAPRGLCGGRVPERVTPQAQGASRGQGECVKRSGKKEGIKPEAIIAANTTADDCGGDSEEVAELVEAWASECRDHRGDVRHLIGMIKREREAHGHRTARLLDLIETERADRHGAFLALVRLMSCSMSGAAAAH